MHPFDRRQFLKHSAAIATAIAAGGPISRVFAQAADASRGQMKLGLVTYQWGKAWDVPTLLHHLEASDVLGVELRTEHAHGVDPEMGAARRKEVKQQFADSPVTLVGLGSNECYDNPDPAVVAKAIERTKAFVKLSHDVGSSGVKVKPNNLHKDVPPEVTIEQIGRSLNTVGAFAADYGQQIRLEVHGRCAAPTVIKAIMDVADNPNVFVCWNSNRQDLGGEGLEHNFNLLVDRFGPTCHIRTLDDKDYPFQMLMDLLAKADYDGWLLMECHTDCPANPIEELRRQRGLFAEMLAISLAKV